MLDVISMRLASRTCLARFREPQTTLDSAAALATRRVPPCRWSSPYAPCPQRCSRCRKDEVKGPVANRFVPERAPSAMEHAPVFLLPPSHLVLFYEFPHPCRTAEQAEFITTKDTVAPPTPGPLTAFQPHNC